jgi:phage terminase small subunit
MANGFTAKQQKFINEYLLCLNATKAALRAGYSERTSYAIGQENLKKPEIKAEIDRIIKENTISPEEVLQQLTRMATLDMEDLYDFPGNIPIFDAEKARANGAMSIIDGFKITDKEMTIKFPNKQKALELMAKYHGLLTDKHELSGSVEIVNKGYISVNPDDWDGDDTDGAT